MKSKKDIIKLRDSIAKKIAEAIDVKENLGEDEVTTEYYHAHKAVILDFIMDLEDQYDLLSWVLGDGKHSYDLK